MESLIRLRLRVAGFESVSCSGTCFTWRCPSTCFTRQIVYTPNRVRAANVALIAADEGGSTRDISMVCCNDDDVIIPGYLDGYEPPFLQSPLVDGSQMMSSTLFWPAFLHTVGGSASAPDAFSSDPADLSELIDSFLDPRRWPVFSLPLAGRDRLHVVMRNFEDDGGIDYVLEPGAGGEALPLAALEGHFRGPALAWPELVAAAQQPDKEHTPAERLLLLLPSCADSDRPSGAVDIVAAALTSIGARSSERQVSAELLDSRRYWAPCQWATVDGALVCLGSRAYRHPGGELSPIDLRRISHAFRPSGSTGRR